LPHRPLGTILKRALRLRCPHCGGGRLFVGYFKMHTHCPGCNLKYERAPGYFLGSTYINYGLTAVLYVALHFGIRFDNRTLSRPLAAMCVLVPLYNFRYARSLWLAIDCYFDVAGFDPDND